MEVIQFGKTLQKLSLSCQTFHRRSNKMNPDRTCNSSSWTKEEDKAFEIALAVYSKTSDPYPFRKIAAVIPGKSLPEIIEHYNVLVEDINDIESGKIPLPKYKRTQSSSSCRSRLSRTVVKRRRGIPWTAEEHRSFVQGLSELGKGDWRGISRKFVFSRSPTQVASHAQKFYKRLHDNNSKKKRSIHDITGVGAAGITEPSQGQKSDELTGPCGGLLQRPITDYVTDAFDTGMLSVPGPVTNCTTDATEGPSAVNPEKSPLDAALGSELNSSFPGVDEFLQSVEGLITVRAEGTSGVCHGVDTRTSPSLNLQPTVAGGTRMYTYPVTVPAEGPSRVRHGVDTRTSPSLSLQSSVAGGTRMYTHPVTVPAVSTSGARSEVDTRISPSLSLQPSIVGDTGMYTHTVTVPAEGIPGACCEIDTRTSPSLSLQPSIVGGMYTHPVTVPAEGTSGACREVDTRTSPSLSLQQSVVGGTGMYTHSITVPAECTSGMRHGIDVRISPSLNLQPSFVGGTGMYTHPVTILAEGTSAACRGVDTRISPSLSLQPSVGGGTGMYGHPVTQLADGSSGARHGVGTRTSPSLNLQPSVVAGTGKYIHPVSVLAEGTAGVRRGVDTSTAPSFNLQPSVGGGTGTYTHPVNNVGYDLEELMTKQLIGASQVGPTVNTASLQLPIADHTGFHGCTASSSGTKNEFASTKGAPEGVFSVNTMQLPSNPPSSGGGTYPCWDPCSNDDDIYDLEDLFSDNILGIGNWESFI